MKKFRIVELDSKVYKYRVDQRHWFLFIPYWDCGSSDLSPYYRFETLEDAEKAILEHSVQYELIDEETKNEKNILQKVLVRNDDNENWTVNVFLKKNQDGKYICLGGNFFNQCIKYCDETAYLWLTNKKGNEKYKI